MVVPVGRKPEGAFLWGKGGQKQSMDAVNQQRSMGQQQMAIGADFSPVGSWTQGLARAISGLSGGLNVRNANRREDTLLQEQAASQAAQQDAILQALMRRGVSAEDAAVMISLGPDAIQSAVMPKEVEQNDFQKTLVAAGIQPGSPEWQQMNRDYALSKSDPLITSSLPGDRFYSGPQSQLGAFLAGGMQPSPAAAPATLPADFSFDEPQAAQPLSAAPQSGGVPPSEDPTNILTRVRAAGVITPAEYSAIAAAQGGNTAGLDQWLQASKIRVAR